MKDNNPPRQQIPLYCTQPSQAERDYEEELHHFPPVRVRNSPPILRFSPSPTRVRAAQHITYDGEDELSDFPSVKVGNDAPVLSRIPGCSSTRQPGATQRDSKQLSLPGKQGASQLQRRRKPNTGLGSANVLNTVDPAVPAKPMLKRDLDIEDTADERPLKKQRLVRDEVADLKKVVKQLAADTQDMKHTLRELLREIQGKQ